ncbi:hypothetical protein BJ741DRAFT_607654 [Chytriomyces cf. hyalinus JEL632]|nr:hypothetical protein BJ741DRAFT_607654 [Chytriomyces cf. hyalinus JEL632]
MSSSPHCMPIIEQRPSPFIHQVQKGKHRHRWKHIKINIPPLLAASSLNNAAAAASGLFSTTLESVVATAVEPADAVAGANVMEADNLQSCSVACARPPAALETLSEFDTVHLPHTPSLNGEQSDACSEADHAFWSEADDGCSGAVYLANQSLQADSKAKRPSHQKNLYQIQHGLSGGQRLNKASQLVQVLPKVSPALVNDSALFSSMLNLSMQCFTCPKIPSFSASQFSIYSTSLAVFITTQTSSSRTTSAVYATRSVLDYSTVLKPDPAFIVTFSLLGMNGVKIFCKPTFSDFKETVTIYLLGIKDGSTSKLSKPVGFFHGSSNLFQLVAHWFLQGFGAEMSCTGIPTNAMEEILKAHCFMNQGNKGSTVTVTLADFSSSKLTLEKREMQALLNRLNESGVLPEFYCSTSFSIFKWLQGLTGLAPGSHDSTIAEIASSTYAIHAGGRVIFKQNITLQQFKTLISFLA